MINESNYKNLLVTGLAIAFSIIKNYHDSEDIVSKSIMKFLNQEQDRIEDPENYFKQIVRNEAKQYYNEQKKQNPELVTKPLFRNINVKFKMKNVK